MRVQATVVARILVLAGSLSALGCAETAQLRGALDTATDRIVQVENNGAYTCAPKELALAQAHLEFAELEIKQGMGSRAAYHYEIAIENLNLADEKSPPDKCAGLQAVVVAPLPVAAPPPPPTECEDDDGDGICNEDDACPNEPEDYDGFEDHDGCPEDQDSDGDGIMDSVDQCPLEPEDFDGYQDEDGCPDLDNDGDGIPDALDKCPADPEDPDGFEDEDGCPDLDNDGDGIPDMEDACPNQPGPKSNDGCPKKYEGVEITETRIEINQTIYFAYNKAKIKRESFSILAVVAEVLNDNPEITLSIEGHTDSRGNDRYNKKLSQQRAQAVMKHLIHRGGVAAGRLTSVGWGEERPIDTNLTDEGRAANRRVEFVRTDKTR